jgi:hypothetical protein
MSFGKRRFWAPWSFRLSTTKLGGEHVKTWDLGDSSPGKSAAPIDPANLGKSHRGTHKSLPLVQDSRLAMRQDRSSRRR